MCWHWSGCASIGWATVLEKCEDFTFLTRNGHFCLQIQSEIGPSGTMQLPAKYHTLVLSSLGCVPCTCRPHYSNIPWAWSSISVGERHMCPNRPNPAESGEIHFSRFEKFQLKISVPVGEIGLCEQLQPQSTPLGPPKSVLALVWVCLYRLGNCPWKLAILWQKWPYFTIDLL